MEDISSVFKTFPEILANLDTPMQIAGLGLLLLTVITIVKVGKLEPPRRTYALLFIVGSMAAIILTVLVNGGRLAAEVPRDVPRAALDTQAERMDGQIFADSSTVRLTEAQVSGLSRIELALARNEIYARNGRHFRAKVLRDHFEQFDWYEPFTWDPMLTPLELQNVALIRAAEERL